MRKIYLIVLLLSGCATTSSQDYSIYAETIKSMNRDNAMSEIACYQQQDEKNKNQCKKDQIKLEPPKKGIFGL